MACKVCTILKSTNLVLGKNIFHVILALNNGRSNLVRDSDFPFKELYLIIKKVRKQCLKIRNYATFSAFDCFFVLFSIVQEYYFKLRIFSKKVVRDKG